MKTVESLILLISMQKVKEKVKNILKTVEEQITFFEPLGFMDQERKISLGLLQILKLQKKSL